MITPRPFLCSLLLCAGCTLAGPAPRIAPAPAANQVHDPSPAAPVAPGSMEAVVAPGATPLPTGSASALPAGPQTLELSLERRYLSHQGETVRLLAVLRDAQGRSFDPAGLSLRYSSSRPQDFSVDAEGLVTALVENGYATIFVSLAGTGLSASQLVSVSSGLTGESGKGGARGTGSAPSEERVEGEVDFEFGERAP